MTIDQNRGLVELTANQRQHLRDKLSAAVAERRHHDQIYLQTFVGGMLILGIYLVALDGAMTREYSSYTMQCLGFGLAILLGCALAVVVYWHIVDQRLKRDICGGIADRVNKILADGRLESTELAAEMSRSVIEERNLGFKKPQFPMKPRDRWEWAYLVIYILMVGLLLTILILAYRPVAQCQADKPPVTTEAEESAKDENRQGSVGIRITMTGEAEADDNG